MFSWIGSSIAIGNGSSVSGCTTMAPMQLNAGSYMTINGQRVNGPCRVEVRGGVLYIDGKTEKGTGADVAGKIDLVINIQGPVTSNISCDCGTITVTGDVSGGVKSVSGDVFVTGDVKMGGAKSVSGGVKVDGNVSGDAHSTSGDIKIKGRVGGQARTMSGRVKREVKEKKEAIDIADNGDD